MKKSTRIVLLILLLLCCGSFAFYYVATRSMADHTPPQITVPESQLQVSVHAEDGELLQGVTALDSRDGDVTDSLVVESVSGLYDRNKTSVTYAAFDSSGNVAKATRTVEFLDYQSPRFTLSAPMIFWQGSKGNPFGLLGVQDITTENLNRRIKGTLVTEDSGEDLSGISEVQFRVTNNLGDTAKIVLPVEKIMFPVPDQQIHLSSYLVYAKVNEPFNPRGFLIQDGADRVVLVDSNVNMSEPGTYTVTYTDQRGCEYGKTRLIVVVEE